MPIPREHPDAAVAAALGTLSRLIDALGRDDRAGVAACLTRASTGAAGFRLPAGGTGPMSADVVDARRDGEHVLITATIRRPDATPPEMTVPFVFLAESGTWKADLPATVHRLLGGTVQDLLRPLEEAMDGLGDAITSAFGGVGDALRSAFADLDRAAPRRAPAGEAEERDAAPDPAAAVAFDVESLLQAAEAAADACDDDDDDDEEEESDDDEAGGDFYDDVQADLTDREMAKQRELLADAVPKMREMFPAWQQQLEMAAGHPVELHLDFDSLDGRHAFLMSLIHGMGAGMSAYTMACFTPDLAPAAKRVTRFAAARSRDGETSVRLDGTSLELAFPCDADGGHPPMEGFAAEMRRLFGRDPSDAPPPAPEEDRYALAARRVDAVEAAMREVGAWDVPEPSPAAFAARTAFGEGHMDFAQWLRYVLIPRVRQIVADRGEFPRGSAVAVYAARNLPGDWAPLHEALSAFDATFE